MSEENKKKLHYGFVVVAGVFLLQFASCLILSAASIFYTPVTQELGISLTSYGATVSILLIADFIMLPALGAICKKTDMRVLLTASLLLEALGFAIRAMATGLWAFYITAVILAIPFAIFMNLSIPLIVNNWFATKPGTMIGVCAASQGIGGMLFSSLGGVVIQNYGWRTCFWMYVVVCLVLLPITLFVIRTKPADKGLMPYGYEEAQAAGGDTATVPIGLSLKKAWKVPGFWLVLVAVPISCLICQVNYYINAYCQSLGLSAAVAGAIAGILQLGVLIFKLALGAVSDKNVGAGAIFYCATTVVAFLLFLFGGGGTVPIVLGMFLYGNIYAATNLYGPIITKHICGTKDFSNIWSIIVMIICLLSGFGSTFWGIVIENFSYEMAFGSCIALSVVLLVLYMLAIGQTKAARALWTTEEQDRA